jgi:Ran GTPase-activating protein (RanGAP) involved in mRNA processing and transport
MKDGLGMKATLESLKFNNVGYDTAALWWRALSFLNTNKTLKSLKMLSLHHNKRLRLTDGEHKQMASLLKKNYALKRLLISIRRSGRGEIWAPSCD